jgi:hypothetical protein
METDKNSIAAGQFVESVAYLLRETFAGSPEGQPSAYLDRGIGIFNTLDILTADEASREIAGMTIAAQTEHAKFYLDRLCEFINGRTERVNWDDSWLIETVKADEWDALRVAVKNSYESTLKCLAEVSDWNDRKVGMAIGLVAHTAYHLGAIRQIAKSAKK